jgi:hypothetical protein
MNSPSDSTHYPFDCDGRPTEGLTEMFVRRVQQGRIDRGQRPADRPVFRKVHGVAHGRLEVLADVPDDLRYGVFTYERLTAWIRFSSDAASTDPDLKSTIGVAIKLFGVSGRKGNGEDGDTADFIFQNHHVFFVDDARAMCKFTFAGVVQGDYEKYLSEHPETQAILSAMQKPEPSVLAARYWGLLPFSAGPGRAVKYRLDPEASARTDPRPTRDYLGADLADRLIRDDYRFRFMVQRRTNPESMPLDQATVEWPENESPYVHVANLVMPRQDIEAIGQREYGESLAFNIFRVPPDQAPVAESTIAAARKSVYAASADVRHRANGQPQSDVPAPRVPDDAPPKPDDGIVKAAIYPAIGIARVGNSLKGWFVGPETPDPLPVPSEDYRDTTGALKRQAARFRIYGLNARGEIVRELTGEAADVDITWCVELANAKAAWYGFQLALDIPEAASAPPTVLRNSTITDRSQLTIAPGSRQVTGPNAGPAAFDTGRFVGRTVYLGEISTDAAGRLIVLGGRGVSASCDGSRAITFANNEGWFDDVADGPVTAEVRVGGKTLEVDPAWVVVAPPNYAPQRKSVRTLWDLMRDVAVKAKMLAPPARPSFTDDILPIFERLAGLQWVNAGFAAAFGWNGAFDLTSSDALSRLSDPSSTEQELRHTIANAFRRFDIDSWSPKPWPWLYGDAMNIPPALTPRQHATLSDLQLAFLDQWAKGDFEADYDPKRSAPHHIDDAPLRERGDLLTRAALEFCLADAFHPGCEMTWPVRSATLYIAPFRIAHAAKGWIAPNLGALLTADSVTIPSGPLAGQQAGGLTRWMAVPWQTDTASCRGGYDKSYDPYAPTFWPARVPNEVLTREDYAVVADGRRSMDDRKAAFARRSRWIAPLGTISYTDQINKMIVGFDHLGVVKAVVGPTDTDAFPRVLEVEDRHDPIDAVAAGPLSEDKTGSTRGAESATAREQEVDLTQIEKVKRFPGGLNVQIK